MASRHAAEASGLPIPPSFALRGADQGGTAPRTGAPEPFQGHIEVALRPSWRSADCIAGPSTRSDRPPGQPDDTVSRTVRQRPLLWFVVTDDGALTGTERWVAGTIAALAWFGLLLSVGGRIVSDTGSVVGVVSALDSAFSFFTIWTNTAVALTVTVPLVRPHSRLGRFFRHPVVQTCVVAAITFVMLVYELLLRQSWYPLGVDLLNDLVVHYLVPTCVIIYWSVFTEKGTLDVRVLLLSAGYYLAYSAWVLLRGGVTADYPYPFIDAAELGYPTALSYAGVLLLVYLVVVGAFVVAGRVEHAWRGRESSAQNS